MKTEFYYLYRVTNKCYLTWFNLPIQLVLVHPATLVIYLPKTYVFNNYFECIIALWQNFNVGRQHIRDRRYGGYLQTRNNHNPNYHGLKVTVKQHMLHFYYNLGCLDPIFTSIWLPWPTRIAISRYWLLGLQLIHDVYR